MKIKKCAQSLQTESAFKVLAHAQQLERQGKEIKRLQKNENTPIPTNTAFKKINPIYNEFNIWVQMSLMVQICYHRDIRS